VHRDQLVEQREYMPMHAAVATVNRANRIDTRALGIGWRHPSCPQRSEGPQDTRSGILAPALVGPLHEPVDARELDGFRGGASDGLRGVADQVLASPIVHEIVVTAQE